MTTKYQLHNTNGTLIVGNKGVKLTGGEPNITITHIPFKKIHGITNITQHKDYNLFLIACNTLSRPRKLQTFEIKTNKIDTQIIHDLLEKEYLKNISQKDKKLGI